MQIVKDFRHVGLVVKDLESMLYFYQKILCLDVIKEADESGAFISAILGLKDARVKTVKMGIGGQIMVELLDYSNPSITSDKPEHINAFGITHFALTVENADALYNVLSENNHVCINSPQLSPDGYAKVFFARDPEGNFIELVELL